MAPRNRPGPADGEQDGSEHSEPAAVTAAVRELYGAAPDRFTSLRSELAARAREHGDADAAKQIAGLRKPTTAAWIVNRQAHEDETVIPRLLDLNDRLRDAHENLDPDALRKLSAERRALVDELTRQALVSAGRPDAAAQVRDDVHSTFDAAVADPSIATRLGRLQRSQSWSGFGVAPATGAALTVLKGGRGRKAAAPRKKGSTGKQSEGTAEPSRALVAARKTLSDAEARAASAASEERACAERVDALSAQLSELEAELRTARTALETAREKSKSARARRRAAQSELNRAERASKA